jgi:hypothetical protein
MTIRERRWRACTAKVVADLAMVPGCMAEGDAEAWIPDSCRRCSAQWKPPIDLRSVRGTARSPLLTSTRRGHEPHADVLMVPGRHNIRTCW